MDFILDGILNRDEAFPFYCFFPLSQPINTINTILTSRDFQSTRLCCCSLLFTHSTALCHFLLLVPAMPPNRGSARNYGTEGKISCLSSCDAFPRFLFPDTTLSGKGIRLRCWLHPRAECITERTSIYLPITAGYAIRPQNSILHFQLWLLCPLLCNKLY